MIHVFVCMLADEHAIFKSKDGLFHSEIMLRWGGLVFSQMKTDGWWRLASSIFVHHSIEHFFGNMGLLFISSILVARFYRWHGFLLIFFVTGISGALIESALHPMAMNSGASGSIFGLFGAIAAVIYQKQIPSRRDWLLVLGMIIMAGFVAQNIVASANIPFIATAAHSTGLVFGILIGLNIYEPKKSKRVSAKRSGATVHKLRVS